MVEHVPQEQQVKGPEEPCIQTIHPRQPQDPATDPSSQVIPPNQQYLDSAVDPAAITPPEEPEASEQEAEALDVLTDPVEPLRIHPIFSEGEPDRSKQEEMQADPPPDPVKEENTCEHQEGMSTQQVQNCHHHNHMALSHHF